MPNELAFSATQIGIQPPDLVSLGHFLARPYERIRVLAFCPSDADGDVELLLSHIEGEGAPGLLDRFVLVPGSSVNQVYEVPGVIVGVSAGAVGDALTSAAVWIWGFRLGEGAPPSTGSGQSQPSTGTLEVRAVLDDGTGGPGESAGAGVVIRLDGTEVGTTDLSGALTVVQPPGTFLLAAVIPSMAAGEREVTLEAGVTTAVTVVLIEQEVIEPADLTLVELVNGALPLDTTTITLQFVHAGAVVPITSLFEVELHSADPAAEGSDLTGLFVVTPEGTIAAVDATSVISKVVVIASDSRLRVNAGDDKGFSYAGTVVFAPGLYRVQVQLEAPPSQPSLPVDGLQVRLRYGTGVELLSTSDSDGGCELTQVPGSMLELEVLTEMGGITYTGQAAIAVTQNVRLLVRLLGLDDLVNGVVPWEVSPLATAVRLDAAPLRDGPAENLSPSRAVSPSAAERLATEASAAATATATVTVAGAAENVPITQLATLQVPQGTEKVILRYLVSTAEYPTYVLQQSRYNDTWGVQVRDDAGAILFSISRGINSQLHGPPTWGPFGDTGTLQEEIDVTALASAADTNLSVIATTTNIGDALLQTDVVAILGAKPKITINLASRDIVVPTDGASDHYSVPRPGDSNTNQRYFDLDFSKPDEVEITKVKAELVDATGAVLQTVVDDEAPGTLRVQQLDETTMRVVVTFSDDPSAIASTPPPIDTIHYRFTMTGETDAGDEVISDPKDSAVCFALWRMPDGFARYGFRDPGGDDWAAQSAYTWLDAHRGLVTRIDDVSGEHARDIGHAEHALGTQVDMFHVFTFPGGAVSGMANYLQLRANVELALTGDIPARTRIDSWAADTRARFDALIAEPQVHRIYYAIGSPAMTPGVPALTNGWARALLTAGTYTNPAGLVLALPAGAWGNGGNAKLRFNAIHNTHFHLDL